MHVRRTTLTEADHAALAQAIRARLAKAPPPEPCVRCRKGQKRHSTNKERSHEARAKARRESHALAERVRERTAYLEKARAYWMGQREQHPGEWREKGA